MTWIRYSVEPYGFNITIKRKCIVVSTATGYEILLRVLMALTLA